jgi:hypothetical protein
MSAGLHERERKVIELVAQGLKNSEIALPSMAGCTYCQYKFVTPFTLKHDLAGAKLYLRESFTCTNAWKNLSHGTRSKMRRTQSIFSCRYSRLRCGPEPGVSALSLLPVVQW